MSEKHVVTVERLINHPIDEVFRRYTDHQGWSRWAGFGPVWLAQEGAPHRDGTGCVRAFKLVPGLREEVTGFEPPARMDYRVVNGAYPLTDHHGEVLFTPEGQGTRITWRVSFRSKIPGIGGALRGGLTLLFRRLLVRFERHLG
jgi:uncharacterized protein YndB with AHSA1/START domain